MAGKVNSYQNMLEVSVADGKETSIPINKEWINSQVWVNDGSGFIVNDTLDQPLSFFPALAAHYAAAIIPEGARHFTGSCQGFCFKPAQSSRPNYYALDRRFS